MRVAVSPLGRREWGVAAVALSVVLWGAVGYGSSPTTPITPYPPCMPFNDANAHTNLAGSEWADLFGLPNGWGGGNWAFDDPFGFSPADWPLHDPFGLFDDEAPPGNGTAAVKTPGDSLVTMLFGSLYEVKPLSGPVPGRIVTTPDDRGPGTARWEWEQEYRRANEELDKAKTALKELQDFHDVLQKQRDELQARLDAEPAPPAGSEPSEKIVELNEALQRNFTQMAPMDHELRKAKSRVSDAKGHVEELEGRAHEVMDQQCNQWGELDLKAFLATDPAEKAAIEEQMARLAQETLRPGSLLDIVHAHQQNVLSKYGPQYADTQRAYAEAQAAYNQEFQVAMGDPERTVRWTEYSDTWNYPVDPELRRLHLETSQVGNALGDIARTVEPVRDVQATEGAMRNHLASRNAGSQSATSQAPQANTRLGDDVADLGGTIR